MTNYLFQLTYSDAGWQELRRHHQDRAEAVRPIAKQLGGDILVSWVSIGDYDAIAIARLPNEQAAMALLVAFKEGGGLRQAKYTTLVSFSEAMGILAEVDRAEAAVGGEAK
jgi:uncharacterized protein with GYD domain